MPSERARVSADREARVRAQWKAGWSTRRSGEDIGITHQAVSYIRRRLGLGPTKYKFTSKYPLDRSCAQCGKTFKVYRSHRKAKLCRRKLCNILWSEQLGVKRHAPDPKLVEQAMGLIDADLTPEQVANIVGKSVDTIWAWVRVHRPNRAASAGWKKRQHVRERAHANAREAVRLRDECGMSLREIAATLGVSRASAKVYVAIGKKLLEVA